jgi:nicotinamidase-related amidase
VSDLELLSPQNCAIALIDFQPAMYQGVQSHDRLTTLNNVQVLAKAAKLFSIPTVLSTVEAYRGWNSESKRWEATGRRTHEYSRLGIRPKQGLEASLA